MCLEYIGALILKYIVFFSVTEFGQFGMELILSREVTVKIV